MRAAPLVPLLAVVVPSIVACAEDPGGCEHLADCPGGQVCSAEGVCVPDSVAGFGGSDDMRLLDGDGDVPPMTTVDPSVAPSLDVVASSLTGDVGPATGIATATNAWGWTDFGTLDLQIDFAGADRTGLVALSFASPDDLRALADGAAIDTSTLYGRGCTMSDGEFDYDEPASDIAVAAARDEDDDDVIVLDLHLASESGATNVAGVARVRLPQ